MSGSFGSTSGEQNSHYVTTFNAGALQMALGEHTRRHTNTQIHSSTSALHILGNAATIEISLNFLDFSIQRSTSTFICFDLALGRPSSGSTHAPQQAYIVVMQQTSKVVLCPQLNSPESLNSPNIVSIVSFPVALPLRRNTLLRFVCASNALGEPT